MSAGDTSEVMLNGKIVKPISELIKALKFSKYNEAILCNEILKEFEKLQQLMKADDGTEMDDINTELQMNMVTTHTVELFA